MTASIATDTRHIDARPARPMAGLRALVRKDLGEWTHGNRAAVVLIVTSLFMTLAAANAWINTWIVANVPDALAEGRRTRSRCTRSTTSRSPSRRRSSSSSRSSRR